MITGRKNYFRFILGGSTGKSCKSPRGYYRGGALTGQGPIQETILGEFFSGALQENPVIGPGQLHEKCLPNYFGNHVAVEGKVGLALKISHGRCSKTTPKVFIPARFLKCVLGVIRLYFGWMPQQGCSTCKPYCFVVSLAVNDGILLVALWPAILRFAAALAALILRLRPTGLRFEEFRSLVKRGGLGLRFSNRSGLRPAAI